jgi:hypothetical protein
MINSLWISKTGMEAQQMQLDVISNNLANVSTTGFKRGHAVFEDLMYQNLRQVGSNTSEQSSCPPACRWAWACAPWPPAATSLRAPAADGQQSGRGHQGQRLLPGHHARRHQRLHPRRLLPGRRQGRMVTASGLPVAKA